MKRVRIIGIFLSFVLVVSGSAFSQDTKEAELYGFAQKLFRDGIFDLAAEQYRQFLKDYPESDRAGEAQFMVGEALFSAEAYATSASEFQVFLIRFPYQSRARDAWFRMAQCHEALGNSAEAATAFLQFQSRFSVDERGPESLLRAAEMLMKIGEFDKTGRTLHLFYREYPQNENQWKAKLFQARLYSYTSDSDSAVILLDEVIASRVAGLVQEAYLEKGKLLSREERYVRAQEVLEELIRAYPRSKVIEKASFELGLLHYTLGRPEEAVAFFKRIVDDFSESEVYPLTQLYLAHSYREAGDDISAINAYDTCLASGPDSCQQEAHYGLALSLANAGRTYEALERLELLQNRFPESEYSSEASLKTGDLLVDLGNYDAAVEKYRQYIFMHPEIGQSDQLQMTIGEIFEKRMGRYQRAADEYHRVLTDYPRSPLTYDALLAIGRCYEQLDDYTRAGSAYEDVIHIDPRSVFADRARERIEWIELFTVQDLEGVTAELLSLLDGNMKQRDEELAFRMAGITFERLKDYHRTIEILEDFIQDYPQSSSREEAVYSIARSYELLSLKHRIEGSPRSADEFDQAREAYRRLRDGYPECLWADDAELFLIKADSRMTVSFDSLARYNEIERYVSFLERYPNSDRLDEVRLLLGSAYMNQARMDNDSLYQQAIENFNVIQPGADAFPLALLNIGHCYQALHRYDLALESFQKIIRDHSGDDASLEAQLGQAASFTSLGSHDEAIDTYRAIVYRYPQSQLARTIRVEMGDTFAETGSYQKAKESYQRVQELGLDIPPDLHYKMATVLRHLGETERAIDQYNAYLKADPEGTFVPSAYYGLARVQEQRNYLDEAAGEYRRLIAEYPLDPAVSEARIQLALVLFDLGQYEDSRGISADALSVVNIPDSLRLELEEKSIVAAFRMGDIVTAETEVSSFRKAHQGERGRFARFELEKGNYYLSQNNGRDARIAFETILEDYDESPYLDDAQYGTGLAFLDIGDYEKAVEAFRTFVHTYSESPLVPSVYLKLGNIYHLQMNFEDAAFSFRRVIDDERSGQLIPMAMFNLIRTYESSNRQDQALQVALEMTRRFPDFEESLRVRIKIGYLNVELGNYDQAVQALEEVLPDVDSNEEPEVRYWIGESYYDAGKYGQALLEYLKVAYLSQAGGLWAVTAEFKAGQSYEALGRLDEARQLYRRMINRYGTDSQWGQAAQDDYWTWVDNRG